MGLDRSSRERHWGFPVAGLTRGGPRGNQITSGYLRSSLQAPLSLPDNPLQRLSGGRRGKSPELSRARPNLHVREAEGLQLMSDKIWHAPRAHLTIDGPADSHRTRFPLAQEDLPPKPAVRPCAPPACLRWQTRP
jgi:hypothetical protein